MQPEMLIEIAGLLGVALYLGSYAALQAGLIKGSGYTYAALNLLAAGFVLVSLSVDWNLSSAIIQISWITISVIGLTRVWILTRSLQFNPEEEHLIASKFPALSRIEARRLLDAGVWADAQIGEVLTEQGMPVTALFFLAQGRVAVEVDGQLIAHVGADQFIGEMACLHKGPASATVRVSQPTRQFQIESDALSQLIRRNPDMAPHLHYAFSGNTQDKLIGTNRAFSEALRQKSEAALGS